MRRGTDPEGLVIVNTPCLQTSAEGRLGTDPGGPRGQPPPQSVHRSVGRDIDHHSVLLTLGQVMSCLWR